MRTAPARTCEKTEALTDAVVVALQTIDTRDGVEAVHVPAEAAVALGADRHAHSAQLGAVSAEDAQQQPPRHALVPQSNADAHPSPGDASAHAPVLAVHVEQPSVAASALQHTPPRHAPEVHVSVNEQGEPGGRGKQVMVAVYGDPDHVV